MSLYVFVSRYIFPRIFLKINEQQLLCSYVLKRRLLFAGRCRQPSPEQAPPLHLRSPQCLHTLEDSARTTPTPAQRNPEPYHVRFRSGQRGDARMRQPSKSRSRLGQAPSTPWRDLDSASLPAKACGRRSKVRVAKSPMESCQLCVPMTLYAASRGEPGTQHRRSPTYV